jgi:hypothetical protein
MYNSSELKEKYSCIFIYIHLSFAHRGEAYWSNLFLIQMTKFNVNLNLSTPICHFVFDRAITFFSYPAANRQFKNKQIQSIKQTNKQTNKRTHRHKHKHKQTTSVLNLSVRAVANKPKSNILIAFFDINNKSLT